MNTSHADLHFTLPDLLRQPQEKVRALQDRLLKETIELCYKYHPFYRNLMTREKLEPRHVQNCDGLQRLPVTTKKDFLSDPEAFRLRGDDLPLEVQVLWKVIYTTGTTSGKPAPIYVPAFDNFAYLFACARRQGAGRHPNHRCPGEPLSVDIVSDGCLLAFRRRGGGGGRSNRIRAYRALRGRLSRASQPG